MVVQTKWSRDMVSQSAHTRKRMQKRKWGGTKISHRPKTLKCVKKSCVYRWQSVYEMQGKSNNNATAAFCLARSINWTDARIRQGARCWCEDTHHNISIMKIHGNHKHTIHQQPKISTVIIFGMAITSLSLFLSLSFGCFDHLQTHTHTRIHVKLQRAVVNFFTT